MLLKEKQIQQQMVSTHTHKINTTATLLIRILHLEKLSITMLVIVKKKSSRSIATLFHSLKIGGMVEY